VVPGQGSADQAGIVADGNPVSWVLTLGGGGQTTAVKKPVTELQEPVALKEVQAAGPEQKQKSAVLARKRMGVLQKLLSRIRRHLAQ
jgi:hypothetical protein